MANTFITPSIVARELLPNLYNKSVFLPLVYRNYANEFQSVGDTVIIKTPAVFEANDFDGDISNDIQNAVESSQPVVMDKFKTVDVEVTSKEMTLEVGDFRNQFIVPMAEALAQAVDTAIAQEISVSSHLSVGTSGTIDGIDDIVAVRTLLNKQKAPMAGRSVVLGPEESGKMLILDSLVEVDKSGTTEALREGSIGRLFGFNLYESNNVYAHTKGTVVTSSNPTLTGAAGASSVTLAAGGNAKTLLRGDLLTVAGGQYVVTKSMTSAADGSGTVEIYPSVPAGGWTAEAVTAITADTTRSVGFQERAVAFVSRPLSMPIGGALGATLNFNGLGLRIVYDYNSSTKTNRVSADMLFGTKVVRPLNTVSLLSF